MTVSKVVLLNWNEISNANAYCCSFLDDSKENCHWNLCKFTSENKKDFIRHLDYHIYHSILKNYGLSLKNLINIPKCLSNSKQRNDIPVITHDYLCNWSDCCKTFSKFPEFTGHLNYHLTLDYNTKKTLGSYVGKMENRKSISKTKVKCKWDGCNKEIVNIYELKRHMRLHSHEKVIGCPVCGKLFTKKTFFIEHCLRQISSEREFQCSQCFKYFATEGMLKDHERSHLNKFKCNICGMSCPSRNVLATHIRYRHVSTKPFSCDHPDCEYRGTTKRDITMHKISHTDEKLYKCEMFQCDFSAKTLMSLKRHDAREHLGTPLTYQCHICEKNFTRGFALSKHLKKEHCFALASGHTRFIYKVDEDGLYRLQTKRVESLAANQQEVNVVNNFVPESDASYSIATFTKGDEKHDGVSLKFERIKDPVKKTIKKVVADDGHKNINDFAIMKNYNFMRNSTRSSRKQISVEFQDLDEFGVTISKKMIKVPEITI